MASGGSPFFSNGHPEVQFLEPFLGSKKNDHKKLAIRKKSTILGVFSSNFNTQLATPVRFQGKKLVKIGGHLPPKIRVQREIELYGTSGMYIYQKGIFSYICTSYYNVNAMTLKLLHWKIRTSSLELKNNPKLGLRPRIGLFFNSRESVRIFQCNNFKVIALSQYKCIFCSHFVNQLFVNIL